MRNDDPIVKIRKKMTIVVQLIWGLLYSRHYACDAHPLVAIGDTDAIAIYR